MFVKCNNAETEPRLLRVTGENLENKIANKCNEARVDKIKRVLAGNNIIGNNINLSSRISIIALTENTFH